MAELQNKYQIVGLSAKCIEDILGLDDDSAVFKKLLPAIKSFNTDYTQLSLNFEVISSKNKISSLYSIRLSHGIRAILCNCVFDGKAIKNQFLIIHVEEDHDKSYSWANKLKSAELEKHLNQDVLKIIMVEELEEKARETTKEALILPFSGINDTLFREIDIDKSAVPFLRQLSTPAFMDGRDVLCKSIKDYSYETLSAIAQELCDDENDILVFFSSEKESYLKAQKLAGGFEIVDRDKELREAIEKGDFEKFRLFLHPVQQELVNDNYKGPIRVLGGAGTGKTVVALYRAKRLASELSGNEKLLFCTFTNSLIDDLSEQLKKICSTEEYSHIEVCTLSSVVSSFWRERKANVLYDNTGLDTLLKKAIDENLDASVKNKSVTFYREELNDVVLLLNQIDEEEYLDADRTGRGTALSRPQRETVFRILLSYMELMEKSGRLEPLFAAHRMAMICKEERITPYKHIIVDECQDFHSAEYKLIRALAGEQHSNDIYITGDLRQAIYNKRAVLSNCGIDIRGRGKYLYINYRTTAGIARYAEKIISNIDLSESESGCKQISERTMSLLYGDSPVVQEFESMEQEASFIINHIKSLHSKQSIHLENICICMLNKTDIDLYREYFTKENMSLLDVKDIHKTDYKDKIHYSTCHNIKGLEYQYIILINASEKHFEYASSEKRVNNTKKLLYVTLTRAQRGVLITSPGPVTHLLPH